MVNEPINLWPMKTRQKRESGLRWSEIICNSNGNENRVQSLVCPDPRPPLRSGLPLSQIGRGGWGVRAFLQRKAFIWRIALFFLILMLTACSTGRASDPDYQQIPNSDSDKGQQALKAYGCGACHTIPGIPGATTTAGPPLTGWAERHYIAGSLPNNPDNLIFWIQNPQQVEPDTAMPDLDVTEEDARHMSAYLYSLTD